jgi:hypothetical protein
MFETEACWIVNLIKQAGFVQGLGHWVVGFLPGRNAAEFVGLS